MSTIRVAGFDPSLRHWGIAVGYYDLVTKEIAIEHVQTIEPVLPKGKQIRKNSQDLESARQIAVAATEFANGSQALFVEVPHGSQSARAMASYGLCVGVLGALRAQGIQFYELTEQEIKLACLGKKTGTKKEAIAWATGKYPQAPWSTYTRVGETRFSEAKVEHQADAVGAIHTGVQHPLFLQTLQMQLAI